VLRSFNTLKALVLPDGLRPGVVFGRLYVNRGGYRVRLSVGADSFAVNRVFARPFRRHSD